MPVRFSIHWAGSKGLRVAIIGDIAHSRVARSNIYLLSKFGAAHRALRTGALLPPTLARLQPA